MKGFSRREIETFLKALDKHLSEPFTLIVIGGSAAALAYKVSRYTYDIDTVNDVSEIQSAYEAAKLETGLEILLGPARVADFPYEYESRLEDVHLSGLHRLRVQVPEKHDLVLIKTVRGQQNDLDTIKEIAENNALDFETLVSRFATEMTHAMTNLSTLRLNFLAMIETVFGEDKAEQAKVRIEKH